MTLAPHVSRGRTVFIRGELRKKGVGNHDRWDIGWIDGPDPITCGICGHGPDNEMEDTNDD